MLVYATRSVFILADPEIPYDALRTYLPLARALLENPATYFSLPQSVTVAPGAVLYMAFWGADPIAIKAANLFIGLASLILAADAARRIAGPAAGAAAAWGFAISHMLISTGITLMGEAPFVFLVFLWFWACTLAAEDFDELLQKRAAAVLLGGLALAAATLTRATWLYWLPAAALAGIGISMLCRGRVRRIFQCFAVVHLIALVLVGGFVLRQSGDFGRPMIATGSGAALYFGSNVVLHGYEPPFFGLAHDEFTVTDHLGHLSLEGDRRLMAVTRTALLNTPSAELFHLYAQKLGAILFFSRAELPRHLFNDRAMRVLLLVFAAVALVAGRRKPLIWLLAGAAAYQCAVHIPVMYNPRYSASALDPPLTLLAAIGFGLLIRREEKRRYAALGGALFLVALGIGFGAWHQRFSEPLMPEISAGPHRLVQLAELTDLKVDGSDENPFKKPALIPDGHLIVDWNPAAMKLSKIAVLNLSVQYFEGQCSTLWMVYTEPTGASRAAKVRLDGLGEHQDIAWGMNAVRLPDHTGRLQLKFECSPGTIMQFGELAIYNVSLGGFYREKALGL